MQFIHTNDATLISIGPAISSTSIVPVDSNLEHGIGSHTDMNCDVTNG